MTCSRYEFDPFLFDAGFHDGVRSSCRLVHPQPYLIMMRSVMNRLCSCFRADAARGPVPGFLYRAARS